MKNKNNFYEFKNQTSENVELYLYGEVSSWEEDINALGFKVELDKIDKNATITAYINSPGGDVFEGIAIANMLQRHKGKKIAIIDGLCASIATTIALAFDEVHMYKNTKFMIHRAWTIAWGNIKDLEQTMESLKKIDESIIQTYVDKTGLTEEKVIEMMDKETWMSANEAKELGFVNLVIDETKEIVACANKDILNKYKNTPKELLEVVAEDINELVDDIDLELLKMQIDLI